MTPIVCCRPRLSSAGERDADVLVATVRSGRSVLAEALDPLEVGEDRELPDQDLGGLGDRLLRVDRAVRGDVEDELVVVGALTDTRRFHVVGDAVDRREHRVDRDDADRVRLAPVALGGQVATATADRQRDLEAALRREVGDFELRVEDLEVGRGLDVGRRHGTRPLLRDVHLDFGRLAVESRNEVLQVQDDVGDVLADARQGSELVRRPLDLDGRDGRALQGGEQHTAQRVAEGVTKAAVERLDCKDPAMVVRVLVDDLGDLEVHFSSRQRSSLFPLLRVELDDQLLLHRRVDFVTLGLLEHLAGEPVVVGL